MKIRWVEAANFRKFVGPVRVSGIGDGINVLLGRNEMGKSTLMEAINGVVFEKAKAQTQQVRSFRHYGHQTVPEVSLGFELDGRTWTLKKRFAGPAGKAFLESSEGGRFEDEEAEAELQRLLGFSVSGRSAEPGIWGTLWVRQGHSFGDPSLDERARRTLQGCLEAQVGVVTGGLRGQRIPEAIEKELGELVSTRGPRGRFKEAIDRLAEVDVQVAELDAKRDQLFEQMERLAELKRELRNLEADWDDEENRRETEAVRAKRAAAERKAEEIKTAQSEATLAGERAQRARADVEARAALVAEIGPLEKVVEQVKGKVAAAGSRKDAAAGTLAEMERGVRELGERERQTAEASRRLQRIRGIVLLAGEIERHEAVVKQAEEKHEEAQRFGEQIGRIVATPALVAKIEEAEVGLAAATAALNAVATTVAFAIEKGAVGRVTFDGKPIQDANAARVVIEDALIGVEGVGTIAVRPQVKDREAVLERIDRATGAHKGALESAGAVDLAGARDASARRRQLELRLEGLRGELARLAPGDKKSRLAAGLDALKVQIEELRGRRDTEMESLGLKVLLEPMAVESQIRENSAEADRLAGEIEAAKAGLDGPRSALEEAKEVYEALRRELAAEHRNLETKKAALAAGREEAGDDTLDAKAVGLQQIASERRAAAAALDRERGETVEEIDARIKRLENAARVYREQATRLRTCIAQASGVITASEGDGVEEALDVARANQARLKAQVRNYEQEVAVLDLLRNTLRAAEAEAKVRYLAPVVTRVEPYLKMLLPGTDLVLDEDLRIAGVKRNGLDEEFARLSDGTQEQIAVLTRLAFAELLLDQGRPATVILDDALVFSDDDRIERMFDIMTRAAERTQIIILTCRQRLFTRLGATMLRIAGDETADRDVAVS
jgi:DNA repair exonuclease SbcCD ATPase subunit